MGTASPPVPRAVRSGVGVAVVKYASASDRVNHWQYVYADRVVTCKYRMVKLKSTERVRKVHARFTYYEC